MLKARMAPLMNDSDLKIFDGHRTILEDEEFVGRVRETVEAGYAAESALFRVIDELCGADAYCRGWIPARARHRHPRRRPSRAAASAARRRQGPFGKPSILWPKS